MKRLSLKSCVDHLRELGIERGDIVHVQSDLRRIGPIDGDLTRAGICEFYLDAFRQALGPEGTLTTLTSFEDYGRWGEPFDRESSPSRSGLLSEYILTSPNAVRSMHPIVSVTAIGPLAEEICSGPHYEGFGYVSPWGELHRRNAKILTLGMGATAGGTTFFHYADNLYGMPFLYTKLFRAPVYSSGQEVPGPFTMAVRYLDFDIAYTPVPIKTRMIELGEAVEAPVGRSMSWCAPAGVIFERMMQMFNENRWVRLQCPPNFRPGEIPTDGGTGEERDSYSRAPTADERT